MLFKVKLENDIKYEFVEADDVVVAFGLVERVGPSQRARRPLPHGPVHPAFVAPRLPVAEHRRQRVGQSAPRVRHHEGRGAPRHSLEVLEVHGGVQHALPRTAPCADHRSVAAEEQGVALHGVEV